MKKKTLVIGATTDTSKYANMAIRSLLRHGHEVEALGIREGNVENVKIETECIDFQEIDTITLYLNPQRQIDYYDYLLGLNPKRIIFNPGTENSEFVNLAKAKNIATEYACTLVLLNTAQY
ncbi:MAG: CoA-binding protein [Bacteroidia bacterium]